MKTVYPKTEWGRDLKRLNVFSKNLVVVSVCCCVGGLIADRFELKMLSTAFQAVIWAGLAMVPIVWILLRRLRRRIGDKE